VAPGKPSLRRSAKVVASAAFCLAGAVAGTGLYFGNLAYVSASDAAARAASASPTEQPGRLYREVTYNRHGTPVFANPTGDPVTSGPPSIPFGTHVEVKCWAVNVSSMGSINASYLIETPPWEGDYAPANTFLNADTGGAIDPDVPQCPPQ
jgi:hypothetical protein